MNSSKISCVINTTNPSATLGVEVWLDNNQIYNNEHVTEESKISYDVPDDEGEHVFKIILKNKKPTDTKIDADGNIIEDSRITVTDLEFDDIALGQILYNQSVYTHDCNGTSETINDKFYGDLGCNGVVILNFTTPIYLWLLENM